MADEASRSPAPTLVFDGDCGFCTTTANWISRHLAPTSLVVLPWQRADLDRLDLTPSECSESVQWVGADGTHAAGADAFASLLRANTHLAPRAVGSLLLLPGIRWVASLGYRFIARYRHRLPGGTPACRL